MAESTICQPVRTVRQLIEDAKLRPEPFISISEALSLIPGMTRSHLAQLRFYGTGPNFYKPTGRTVLYKASEVLDWVESNERKAQQ